MQYAGRPRRQLAQIPQESNEITTWSPGRTPRTVAPTASTTPVDGIERELTVLFDEIRRAVVEAVHDVHPDLEVNAFLLMLRLAEDGPTRLTDVAAHFGVGKATMSRQFKALERLGLVERADHPADARASLLKLTGDGYERFMTARTAQWEWRREHFATWHPEDIATFSALLARFNDMRR